MSKRQRPAVTPRPVARIVVPDGFDDLPPDERRAVERAAALAIDARVQLASGACSCPRCEQLVPGEFVARRIRHTDAFEPTRAEVRAYCQHCDFLWDAEYVLRAGQWVLDADPAGNQSEFAKLCHFTRIRRRIDNVLRPVRAAAV